MVISTTAADINEYRDQQVNVEDLVVLKTHIRRGFKMKLASLKIMKGMTHTEVINEALKLYFEKLATEERARREAHG